MKKKDGAPPMPYRYRDNDWVTVTYTVHGRQQAPWSARPLPELLREAHRPVNRTRLQGGDLPDPHDPLHRGGFTSWNGVKQASATGLSGGTLRLELLPVPTSVTRRFDVLLVDPRISYAGGGPSIGIRPKTTQIAKMAASFAVQVRASEIRAGVRVYSNSATWTVDPLLTHPIGLRGARRSHGLDLSPRP